MKAFVLAMVAGLAVTAAPLMAQGPAQPGGGVQPGGYPQPDAKLDGEKKFQVSRFLLEYEYNNLDHPALQELFALPVALGVVQDKDGVAYTHPRDGLPTASVRIGDFFGDQGAWFYEAGIGAVTEAISREMNEGRHLIGIRVVPHPDDIEWGGKVDKRRDRRGLRLKIFTAFVQNTTVRVQTPGVEDEDRLNPPRTDHIRFKSPLNVGNLIRKDLIDDHVAQLNRHPGRQVDVALVPSTDRPGEVELQYLLNEVKPWSIYAQLANIGTKTTSEWRERVGFVHNQLTDNDDILRIDYSTATFDSANQIVGSYERPLVDDIRWKVFGSYSEYTASDVGLLQQDFSGNQYSVGAEVTGNIYQSGQLFVDWLVGAKFEHVEVENKLILQTGDESFLLPYLGVKLEKNNDYSSLWASAIVEFSMSGVTNVDENGLQDLGRIFPDKDWTVLKYEFGYSTYIEPLLAPKEFKSQEDQIKGATLAHEVFVGLHGQNAFGSRLTPTYEGVAGGFYTVRGYPESISSGDDVIVGNLEYRFHLPRTLLTTDKDGKAAYMDPAKTMLFGSPFHVGPAGPFGRTDWDLIFRGFLDVARTINSDRQVFEQDKTLASVGVGAELQFLQNVQVRVDLGVALQDVATGVDDVNSGDTRLHFSLTFLY